MPVPDTLADPSDTMPAHGGATAFLPPPGGIPLRDASGGVIFEPPGSHALVPTSGSPVLATQPVVLTAPRVAYSGRRIGWYAFLFYGVTMLVAAFFVPAWLSALHQKGVDTNTSATFAPTSGELLSQVTRRVLAARSEVLVAARFVNNPDILHALLNRQQAGLTVVVLLTRDEKSSLKTASYLTTNGFPQTRLFFDTLPVSSQLIVIDRETVITGNLPFNSQMAASSGDMLVMMNPRLALQYRTHIEERVRASVAAP